MLELARLLKDVAPKDKRLRLVLFVNEEPPYDRTPDMGSARYALMLKDKGERVAGMLSLETIGCFSEEPGSQKYPPPFGLVFPNKANFVAFVAMPGSRTLPASGRRPRSAGTRSSRPSAARRPTRSTASAGRITGRSGSSAIRR